MSLTGYTIAVIVVSFTKEEILVNLALVTRNPLSWIQNPKFKKQAPRIINEPRTKNSPKFFIIELLKNFELICVIGHDWYLI